MSEWVRGHFDVDTVKEEAKAGVAPADQRRRPRS